MLVLAATGKVGQGVCRALKEAGFDVFGTSRTAKSGQRLAAVGVAPVVCNYTNRADLDKALKETGATKVFVLTVRLSPRQTFHHAITPFTKANVGVSHRTSGALPSRRRRLRSIRVGLSSPSLKQPCAGRPAPADPSNSKPIPAQGSWPSTRAKRRTLTTWCSAP